MEHHSQSSDFISSLADLLPLFLILTITLLYIFFALRVPGRKKGWNKWRMLSFIFGAFLLFIAMHPSTMHWAHGNFRGHMVQHLLLAMFAPIFLVLGAPISLALKSFPVKFSRKITYILRSSFFYILSHPFTALLLNTGGMFALYLTPLYIHSLDNPILHYLIHFHFLAAGYLFTWSIIGIDPVPKKPGMKVKIFALFLSIAAHAFLSKYLYAYLYPVNAPYGDDQIRQGAKLMYYWGDLSELLLAIVLFTMWYRSQASPSNQQHSLQK